jgi:glycogen synthase
VRILLLSSEIIPERAGGIATYTATIAPAIAARGHEVHVLSCAPEHTKRDDVVDGVCWHRRPLLAKVKPLDWARGKQTGIRLATAMSCRTALRSRPRFDVIESPEWLAESLVIGATTRIPVVVNLHTPLALLFSFDVPRNVSDVAFADRLERTAVRRADLVSSTSHLLADDLKQRGWVDDVHEIVFCPVDVERFAHVEPPRSTPPTILAMGRLEPRKAPEVLVDAAAILRPEIADLRVTFVGRSRGFLLGGKPYGDFIAERAADRHVPVEFVAEVPHHEAPSLYARSRVVCVPSRFESFSMTALEGMASARPVVYSSRIGAAEVLRGTDAGAEAPPDDAEALAQALRPYLIDAELAAVAGERGRQIVTERCHPSVIAEQRERCYIRAIHPSRQHI